MLAVALVLLSILLLVFLLVFLALLVLAILGLLRLLALFLGGLLLVFCCFFGFFLLVFSRCLGFFLVVLSCLFSFTLGGFLIVLFGFITLFALLSLDLEILISLRVVTSPGLGLRDFIIVTQGVQLSMEVVVPRAV